MVLAELGGKLQKALGDLSKSSTVDENVLDGLLKEVCNALLESDVNVALVASLRNRVRAKVLPTLQAQTSESSSKKNILHRAVYEELVALVDCGQPPGDGGSGDAAQQPPWKPRKGHSSVLMMVGLQGAGKTTTCTKLAMHYARKGFKTALVCADTFRAGAFDQLKQNATKAKIPFYGSYVETDPAAIAAEGVHLFKTKRVEVIIVDTSGRHKQEAELFQEMQLIDKAVNPDFTLLVLDGAIGQAAEAQSRAFKDAAGFAGIVVTKMDGHARGGGAISAVAATRTPIMFIGTGEHQQDLERFSPKPFISKMLGMGDLQGLMEHVQDVSSLNDPKKQQDMLNKMEKGVFTIRDMREQMNTVLSMGPLSKVANMIPGMGAMLAQGGGDDQDATTRVKKVIYITDSMNAAELDSDGSLFLNAPAPPAASTSKAAAATTGEDSGEKQLPVGHPRRPNKHLLRVARGSGTSVSEVEEVLAQHRMLTGMVKQFGGLAGMAKAQQQGGSGAGGMPAGLGRGRGGPGGMGMPSQAQIQQMQRSLPPQFQGPGGMAQLQQMARSMGITPGQMPDMGQMSQLMSKMGMGGMMG